LIDVYLLYYHNLKKVEINRSKIDMRSTRFRTSDIDYCTDVFSHSMIEIWSFLWIKNQFIKSSFFFDFSINHRYYG